MSNPTNPFSWQMPTATDLVTDLPADFEVFGQAVATSLADLLGGTTGQVLKKNTNADMDFVWSTDAAGMTNPMTTTGDTIYSSSGSTPARLGIGTTGQVLTVAGGLPSWATPAGGGGKVLQVISATTSTSTSITTSTYTDTTITATITPTSATSKILVMIAANSQIYTNTARVWISGKGRIMRGATEILANDPDSYIEGASSAALAWKGQQSYIYLDSPATTSATTYKLQGAIGTGYAILFQSGATSTITLLEIGA